MILKKLGEISNTANWKIALIADDYFLINSDAKFSIKIDCDPQNTDFENIPDICYFKISSTSFEYRFYGATYVLKYRDALFIFCQASTLEIFPVMDEWDENTLVAVLCDKKYYLISFFEENDGYDNYQYKELGSIDGELVSNLDASFLESPLSEKVFYYEGFFYLNNIKFTKPVLAKKCTQIFRFNSERLDTYEIPKNARYFFSQLLNDAPAYVIYKEKKNTYVLIDIQNFEIYDITKIYENLHQSIFDFYFHIYHLFISSGNTKDYIFISNKPVQYVSPQNMYKSFTYEVSGFLYDCSSESFVFPDLSYKNGELRKLSFYIYDYSIPNIVNLGDKIVIYCIDKNTGEIKYITLKNLPEIVSHYMKDDYQNSSFNRYFFPRGNDSANEIYLITNSILLEETLKDVYLHKIEYSFSAVESSQLTDKAFFDGYYSSNIDDKSVEYYDSETSTSSNNTDNTPARVYHTYDGDFLVLHSLKGSKKYKISIPGFLGLCNISIALNSYKKFNMELPDEELGCVATTIVKCVDSEGEEEYLEVNNNVIIPLDKLALYSF